MEESVLERLARGDSGGVQEALDRFGGLVWSLVRRMVKNSVEAEDAVQEIFIDLWRSAERFDPERASEATFVAMIARRRLIDRRRKKERNREVQPLPPEEALVATAERDGIEIADEASHAAQALDRLRPEQRRVLELSIYHGRTHQQISRDIGMPIGTVKSHARRGLMRVREMLNVAHAGEAGEE